MSSDFLIFLTKKNTINCLQTTLAPKQVRLFDLIMYFRISSIIKIKLVMDLNLSSDWPISSWILTRVPACRKKVQIVSWKASVDRIPQAENIWNFGLQVIFFSALFLLFVSCCDTVSGTGTMQITLTIRLLDIAEQLTSVSDCTHQPGAQYTNNYNKLASLEAMFVWNYDPPSDWLV